MLRSELTKCDREEKGSKTNSGWILLELPEGLPQE